MSVNIKGTSINLKSTIDSRDWRAIGANREKYDTIGAIWVRHTDPKIPLF